MPSTTVCTNGACSNRSAHKIFTHPIRLAAIAGLLLLSVSAYSVDRFYDPTTLSDCIVNPDFNNTACWTGGFIPNSSDDAHFDSSSAATYTVNFNLGDVSSRAEIKTDNLIWDLNNNTYDLTATTTGANSALVVGRDFGDMANLIIQNGTVDVLGNDNVGRIAVGQSNGSSGVLTLGDSGILSDEWGFIGTSSGSTGTVNIDGVGAQWTNTAGVIVGFFGTGMLNILNGSVSNMDGRISNGAGGAGGTVNVGGGSGSAIWNNSGSVYVGGSPGAPGGPGVLNILNLGEVNVSNDLKLWNQGTLNLSGGTLNLNSLSSLDTSAGGIFNWNSGTLDIDSNITLDGSSPAWLTQIDAGKTLESGGFFVNTTLAVSDSGVVSSGGGILGENLGDTGTVTVDGIDSRWTNSGALRVGFGGTGVLNITNGGEVSNALGLIGQFTGSNGAVTVDGAGSSWESVNLDVGFGGTGVLNITNGGEVSSTRAWVGDKAGSEGTVTVDGTDSIWTNAGDLEFGEEGTATLSLIDNGLVTVTGDLLNGTGTGTINIDGGILDVAGAFDVDNLNVGNAAGTVGAHTVGATDSISANALVVGQAGTGTLNINNGGTVSNTTATVGGFAVGDGTVSVDGTDSSWTNSSDLTVGEGGTGVLNIANGGSVTNASASVGSSAGGDGTVTVDGTDSSWTNSSDLTVGEGGTGVLNIANGGSVTNASASVGSSAGSDGTVTVDGTGSSWTNDSGLFVGRGGGTAVLNITNGGEVSNDFASVGTVAGSDGTVTVDGAGSSWTNDSGLFVGDVGTGVVNIVNGGEVSNDFASVGSRAGSDGTVTVDGAGSSWANSSELVVGESGTGVLNITNGGEVTNTLGRIGSDFGSDGTVTVDGTGSSWTNSSDLTVGEDGTGVLNITNGGAVSNMTAFVGGSAGGNDTVTVDGAGSSWTNSDLYIGGSTSGAGGNGTVTIGTGGTIQTTNTTKVWSTGTLNLSGGTLSTGSLENNGGFSFNSGTLNLTNDDLVIGLGGLFGGLKQFDAGQTMNVTNTTTVDSASILALNNAEINSGTTVNNGSIDLTGPLAMLGGGTVTNNGLLSGDGGVSASLNNASGGEVRVTTGDAMTLTGASNSNDGLVNLLGGTAEFQNGLTNNSGGEITGHGELITDSGLTNNGIVTFSDTTDVQGNVANAAGGSITVSGQTTTFFDDVEHNGTEFLVTSGSQAIFQGAYAGGGNFTGTGELIFAGDVLPGNSPDLIDVEGDFTLLNTATTLFELGGTLRGTEYDAFDIGGDLLLAGTLDVASFDLGGGVFSPQEGDTFDLFAAENIDGSFDVLNLFSLGAELQWSLEELTDYVGTTDILRLTVTSVPVPGAAWLFGSALLLLCAHRRRSMH